MAAPEIGISPHQIGVQGAQGPADLAAIRASCYVIAVAPQLAGIVGGATVVMFHR